MGRIVKMKLDIIFKKLFTDKNNADILQGFISDILDIPYESIKKIMIENPEVPPEDIGGKFSRLDLKLQVDDKLINVEVQLKAEPDFADRTMFYWAKLYTSDLKSGDLYGKLKQSIAINIINFNMFDCKEYHSAFMMMEKDRYEVLTDKCAIHFFELKKIGKNPNKHDRKEVWMQLINAESEEELDMLDKTEIPAIKKAVVEIKKMSNDDRMKEAERMREKALHDEASALYYSRMEGIQEGMVKGIQQGKMSILAGMKSLGFSEEDIKKVIEEAEYLGKDK